MTTDTLYPSHAEALAAARGYLHSQEFTPGTYSLGVPQGRKRPQWAHLSERAYAEAHKRPEGWLPMVAVSVYLSERAATFDSGALVVATRAVPLSTVDPSRCLARDPRTEVVESRGSVSLLRQGQRYTVQEPSGIGSSIRESYYRHPADALAHYRQAIS